MSKLYSNNQLVANTVAQTISQNHITAFNKQCALHVFIEDIKFPFLKNCHSRKQNPNVPAYVPNKNYDPIIFHLIEKGVLTRGTKDRRVTYSINKKSLQTYIENI